MHIQYAYFVSTAVRDALLDASLIEGLASRDDRRPRAQVDSMLDMAKKSGMTVIAEGVETLEQLAVLDSLSCPLVQGFYFAAAERACAIESYLDEWCYRTSIDLTLVDTDYEHDSSRNDAGSGRVAIQTMSAATRPIGLAPAAGI